VPHIGHRKSTGIGCPEGAKQRSPGQGGPVGIRPRHLALSARRRPGYGVAHAPKKQHHRPIYRGPSRRVAAGRETRAGAGCPRDLGRQTTLARLALPLPWATVCKAFSLKRSLVAQYLLEFPHQFCYATRTARGTTVSPKRTECAPNVATPRYARNKPLHGTGEVGRI
jgi:hypothetical protein